MCVFIATLKRIHFVGQLLCLDTVCTRGRRMSLGFQFGGRVRAAKNRLELLNIQERLFPLLRWQALPAPAHAAGMSIGVVVGELSVCGYNPALLQGVRHGSRQFHL